MKDRNFIFNQRFSGSLLREGISLKVVAIFILLQISFFSVNAAYVQPGRESAQQEKQREKRVSGTVLDDEGNPLPGVSVHVTTSNKGVITDDKGRFSISVPIEGAELYFSFIGFSPQTVKVGKKSTIDIQMVPKEELLGEVVVTGMFEKDISTFTGAATTISGEELRELGNRNIITKISLLDPSVFIVENNTEGSNPNHLPNIEIRGNSSIPNVGDLDAFNRTQDEARARLNTPLIIFDGFEISLEQLYDLNEEDVASVTILKDASATAIYGSRGANGIIVVTSKRPSMGNLRISYTGNLNIQAPDLTSYNMLNAREKLDLEVKTGLRNAGSDIDGLVDYNETLNAINSGVNTYWMSKPLRVGRGQRHNIRMEGGDRSFRYIASMRYDNNMGVMLESSRETFNGALTISYYKENVRITNSLNLTQVDKSDSPYGSFANYAKMNPYLRPYDDEGELIRNYRIWQDGRFRNIQNPLYNGQLNTYSIQNNLNILNNLMVELSVLKDLRLRGSLSISKMLDESDKFKPAEHTEFSGFLYDGEDKFFEKGNYAYSTGSSMDYNVSLNLSYSKTLKEKHTIYTGVDFSLRESTRDNYSFEAIGFQNEDFDFLPLALGYKENARPGGSENQSRNVGLVGNFNYSYDKRYFFDGSVRMDGSSQFGADRRFAPFWATGFGWNVHNEEFLKDHPAVSHFKLRYSVGVTGAQNFSPYQALSTYDYSVSQRYWYWIGASMMALGNTDLKWQENLQNNLGIELKIFDNRLSFDMNVYQSMTRDLISSVDIPLANGFRNYIDNIGKIKNKGIDARMTAVLIRKKGLNWRVTVSGARNKNKVIALSPAFLKVQSSVYQSLGVPNLAYVPGYSTNTIWVVRSLGIDPSTGAEVFLSKSGEQVSKWSPADIVAYKTTTPKLSGSLSSSFSYKKLSLRLTGSYKLGAYTYNSTLASKVESNSYGDNVDRRVYEGRWEKPGDIKPFKSLNNTSSSNKSTRFVQQENTFALSSMGVTYRLTKQEIKKYTGIKGLDAMSFTFNTSDLLYFSTIRRERGTGYPYSRQFSLSINTSF